MTEQGTPQTASGKPRGRLRDPIWQFLSFVAAIFAVGISLYSSYDIYVKAKPSKHLEIRIAYSASLISPQETGPIDFEFLYNGERIDCASVVGLHVENAGNVPILPRDFVSPITISVPSSARIAKVKVEYSDPQSLQPHFSQIHASEIVLQPLLLNPGDTFVVDLTVLALRDPPDATLMAAGRIVGVKDVELIPRSEEGRVLDALGRAYNTEAMVMIPVGTLVCFLLLLFWPKLWDWIEHVFGRRPESTWGRISLNLATATLLAIALEDIVEGMVEVVKAILAK